MLGWSLRWKVMKTDWYNNRIREEIAKMNLSPKAANRLLAGLSEHRRNIEKTVAAQQQEDQVGEVDKQLEESDRKDLGEKVMAMADEAKLDPNKYESTAKEELEKEASEERILF